MPDLVLSIAVAGVVWTTALALWMGYVHYQEGE